MVVSVTQKTINDQLTSRTKMQVIPSHLILIRTVDPKIEMFVYEKARISRGSRFETVDGLTVDPPW